MTHITQRPFGRTAAGVPVTLYTLTNGAGNEAAICSYGGTLVSLKVPGRDGRLTDVLLGYDDLAGYESRKYFFGATVGRCANRIGKGRFTLGGREYRLNLSDGNNHLHGGFKGFDSKVWDCAVVHSEGGDSLSMRLVSPDGDEHYPGNLRVTVTCSFSDANELTLHYTAVCDADTICNLTNHAYFNLAGHDSGSIEGHQLKVYADRFTETDGESIPTGKNLEVAGTPFDFREFHPIGERIGADYEQLRLAGGYDHNFVLRTGGGKPRPAAELYDEASGRHLTCLTTCPGVQLYTGNYIDGTQKGKGGCAYQKRGGVCLETQFIPDAVNHPEWDSPVLKAGQTYDRTTVYRFSVR